MLPTEKSAWNRLINERGFAFSTCTPSAFMATSIAPLPRPRRTTPTTSIGYDDANPITTIARTITAPPTKVGSFAPERSATRPETFMASTAAAPQIARATPILASSRSSRSRSPGSEPPNAPTIRPLVANRTKVAAMCGRAAGWFASTRRD